MTSTSFNKDYIESKSGDDKKFDAQEFFDLIKGDEVTRAEVLTGLEKTETLNALIAVKGENNKNISDVIKESLINNRPVGFDILKINSIESLDQASLDFIELCALGWVIENKGDASKTMTSDNFLSHAQEFYKNNLETKEILDIKNEGYAKTAEADMLGKNTESTVNINLESVEKGQIIKKANITVSAEADNRIWSKEGASNKLAGKIEELEGLKAKLDTTNDTKIDELIAMLKDPTKTKENRSISAIKKNGTTEIITKENLKNNEQEGNVYGVFARIAEGYIEAINAINKKGTEEAELSFDIDRENCKIEAYKAADDPDKNSGVGTLRQINVSMDLTVETSGEDETHEDTEETVIITDDTESVEDLQETPETLKIGNRDSKTFIKQKDGATPAGEVFGTFNVPEGKSISIFAQGFGGETEIKIKKDYSGTILTGKGALKFTRKGNVCSVTYSPEENTFLEYTEGTTDVIKISGDGLQEKTAIMTMKTKKEDNGETVTNNTENNETLTNKAGSARRFIIANKFGLDINQVDETGDTRAVGGYKGLKFSKIENKKLENDSGVETGKIKQTFKLIGKNEAKKGLLKYTTTEQEFSVIQNANGSYNKSEFTKLTDFDSTMTLKPNIEDYENIAPEGFEIKTVAEDKLTFQYIGKGLTAADGSEITFDVPIDKNGKLAYNVNDAGDMVTDNSNWINLTISGIKGLESGYRVNGGSNKIEDVKFYTSMTDGELKIINNVETNNNKELYPYIKNVEALDERIDKIGNVYFRIYQSSKNESAMDQENMTSGKIELTPNGGAQYVSTLLSNSGAKEYKVVIPITDEQAGNGVITKNFGKPTITRKYVNQSGSGEAVDMFNNRYVIDGVVYNISASRINNVISMEEDEAGTKERIAKKHPANLSQKLVGSTEKIVEEDVLNGNKVIASISLPTVRCEEVIRQEAGETEDTDPDKMGSYIQNIKFGEQELVVHYDEDGIPTYVSKKNEDEIFLFEKNNKTKLIIDYLGEEMYLVISFDKNNNISITPEYNVKGGYEDENTLLQKILYDKEAIYDNLAKNSNIDGRDVNNFKFPANKLFRTKGANIDKDWGKGSSENRIKGPSRNGIYTVTMLEGSDRWQGNKSVPDFKLRFTVEQKGNKRILKLVNADGNEIQDPIKNKEGETYNGVRMPMSHPMQTKLSKNYIFYIKDGELHTERIETAPFKTTSPFKIGESFEFMGKDKVIEDVYEDGDNFKLHFSDNTSGLIFGKRMTDGSLKIDKYKGYEGIKTKLKDKTKVEGKEINTFVKDTLLQKIKNSDISKSFFKPYPEDQMIKYISTLGDDDLLFTAISGLILKSEKYESRNNNFVPIMIDGHFDVRLVKKGEDIKSFTDNTESWDMRGKALGHLTKQISYLKKAEEIELDIQGSREMPTGLSMYYDKELWGTDVRAQILSGNSTPKLELKTIVYKFKMGKNDPVEIPFKISPQNGEITGPETLIKLAGNNYRLNYKKKENKVEVERVTKIKETKEKSK